MAIVYRRIHKVLTIQINTLNSIIQLNVPVNSYTTGYNPVGLYCIKQQPIKTLRFIFHIKRLSNGGNIFEE